MEQLTDFELDKQKMLKMFFDDKLPTKKIAKVLISYSEQQITNYILAELDKKIDAFRDSKKHVKIEAEKLDMQNLPFIDRIPYSWHEKSLCVGDVKIVKGEMMPKINKLIVR